MPRHKLTPEMQSQICSLIRSCNWSYVAAEAVGIHRSTLYRWLQYGRNAQSRGQHNQYRVFLEAVERAESEGEALVVEHLRKAIADDDVNASQWWLVHRFPGRWGLQQSRQEISGEGGGPISIKVVWDVPRPGGAGSDAEPEHAIRPDAETSGGA